ncbi:MAG: hypothetical protein WCP65_06350 [Bacteroidota bacterium]
MDNNLLGIGSIVEHPSFGKGTIVDLGSDFYVIYFKSQGGTKSIGKDYSDLKVVEKSEAGVEVTSVTLADIELALENVLKQRLHDYEIVPMALKWNRGTMILKPFDSDLQSKEVPIETFFHKIVMVRDRLRLIEQKINSHKGLTDEEKVDMQQYITASYGTLTTFNVLFKETIHQFKGVSTKD